MMKTVDFMETFLCLCLQAMSVSPLPMSEVSQQSSRWQQESDAPGLQITEVQTVTCWLTCCLQPPSRPLSGRKQSRLPLKCSKKGNRSVFTARLREQQLPKGCHFPVCEWVAVGCGLSLSGPGLRRFKGCDGPCLGTQTREEDVGPKGPVVTHSSTPPALPPAMTKISDPVMQTLRSQHHAFTHKDVYIVFLTIIMLIKVTSLLMVII